VNRGDPLLETSQLEMSVFVQNDWRLSPRLTAMFGARYDAQTNLADYNNFGPRLGFAYAIGQATVLRFGGGIFYNRLTMDILAAHRRLDGTRQVEIVVDTPSYPDPFLTGTIRNTRPSVRVTDPTLMAPYLSVGMISFERTFLTNLFMSVTYDYSHEVHRFRSRNLNAPLDITAPYPRSCTPLTSVESCVRPEPDRGNILSLESTGNEIRRNLRFSFRQRFSIFNVTANYTLASVLSDARPNAIDDLPTDNYDLRSDWTRVITPTHTFSSTVNSRMPLGVFLTGSVSTNSGRLYGVTTGKDDNRDTVVNDRPPGLARFSAMGPGYLSFNFNISKAFFLGGPAGGNGNGTRKNLNLFANMTNAFNRLNYGVPSGVMTSPNFGKSTSAVNPREIEVGMRFQF
jgi:outer membrane receptor protein involved in Fe transport